MSPLHILGWTACKKGASKSTKKKHTRMTPCWLLQTLRSLHDVTVLNSMIRTVCALLDVAFLGENRGHSESIQFKRTTVLTAEKL